jgi:hypothetical protein
MKREGVGDLPLSYLLTDHTLCWRMEMKQRKFGARTTSGSPVNPYQPTPFERAALEQVERDKQENPVPQFSIGQSEDGVTKIISEHENPEAARAAHGATFGTTHQEFFDTTLAQLLNVTGLDEKKFNGIVQAIAGIQPRDHVETMLASQMAAIHTATMDQARRLMHCTSVEARDMAEKALNRLARTFAAQTEALKKYRSTADQRITVTHVNVGDGGQAIVGNVTGGGRAAEKEETTP